MTRPRLPAGYINIHEVSAFTTWSRATIWRRVKDGDFPRPHILGPQKRGWDVDEVAAWKASRQPTATN